MFLFCQQNVFFDETETSVTHQISFFLPAILEFCFPACNTDNKICASCVSNFFQTSRLMIIDRK